MDVLAKCDCSNQSEFDSYYVAYHIMVHALSAPNIREGLEKSLFLSQLVLDADDIVLFRKNSDGIYEYVVDQPYMIGDFYFLSKVLNSYEEKIERKGLFHIGFKTNEYSETKGTTFMYLPVERAQYVLTITNKKLSFDNPFIPILFQTYRIILDNLETYNQIKRESVKDSLTGLDNRRPYSEKMSEIDQNEDEYYYILFDLFRLKFVNDHYGHILGDQYIMKVADILRKHFPKYILKKDKNGKMEKNSTGGCVYRIGGDEFVLIAKKDAYKDILTRAHCAIEDVSKIKLDTEDDILVGLNLGFSYRNNHQTSSELYLEADKYLSLDKSKMYCDYHINRRK